MASDQDTMRGVIGGVLRSRACMSIEFGISGMSIMPYGYGYVADMLDQGAISIGFADIGPVTAQYSPSRFTFGRNALASASSADGRATIVHEATHAQIDGTHPGKYVDRGDNEMAAYLAETIYRINAGDPTPDDGYIGAPLVTLARKVIALAPDGFYELTPYDYENLKPQILAVYRIIAAAQGKTVPPGDVMKGFKLPWDPSTGSLSP
jgi:hypothetical protein